MARAKNVMLCWTPGEKAALVPWPDNVGLSDRYQSTTLACWAWFQEAAKPAVTAYIFIEAMHLIVRDGIDPMQLHGVLLGIDEYADACAADMPNGGLTPEEAAAAARSWVGANVRGIGFPLRPSR